VPCLPFDRLLGRPAVGERTAEQGPVAEARIAARRTAEARHIVEDQRIVEDQHTAEARHIVEERHTAVAPRLLRVADNSLDPAEHIPAAENPAERDSIAVDTLAPVDSLGTASAQASGFQGRMRREN
jgi:hypothetical protein